VFADARIIESSGLVDLGATMVTTNDSGSESLLYRVDGSGRTVDVVDFGADTYDVEALAPAGGNAVHVGDIGDNSRVRSSVQVYLVDLDRRRPTVTFDLVYPDGPHDAESMVIDRRGRVYLITKGFTGGGVYRTPGRPDASGTTRLERVGRVADYATDAALLPGGRHVLVRSYGSASVYTFPRFRRLRTFALPPQPQGEGVSVGPAGRVRTSSEGVRTPVLQIAVPAYVAPARPSDSSTPQPEDVSATADDDGALSDDPWLWWSVAGVVVAGALGVVGLGLGRRRRAGGD